MMKSNRLLLAGLLVGASFSCARQEADVPVSPGRELFYACLEQPADAETRVYADENLMVLWHADDRVSIFDRYTYNQEYRFTGETGDNAGAFQKVQTDDFVTGNELPNVYAVYPYQASTRISNAQVLTLTLPSEQMYAVRSFGPGANTMVSATEDNNLLFKNVGGYLVLKLYGEGVYVTSLTLKGNADEPLAGKAVVTAPLEGVPSVEMQTGASREITLTCPEPVALGATAEDYTEFWFVLPPTSFAGGLTVTVTGGKGDRFTKTTERSITITRSEISRMAPLKVSLEPGFDTMPIGNVPDIADGSTVHVRGLVSAVATRAFVMSENDSHILIYTGPGAVTCSLGDSVTVSGTKATYRGVAEITSPELSVSVESSGHALPELDYQDITASFDTFSAGCSVPICFRGTLTKSGTQYNVTVEGAERTGYIYWPVAGFVDENLLGSSILVKGFYQGRYNYTTGAFLDIVATCMEAAGQPDNEIWYTSTDGKVVEPTNAGAFDANIISNTYADGKGILRFDKAITRIVARTNSTSDNAAFGFCQTLLTLSIPASVREIGFCAFYACNNLSEISLPEYLDYCGNSIVSGSSIVVFRMPETKSILGNPTAGCASLQSFTGPYATADGRGLVKDNVFIAFAPLGMKEYSVPDGITEIGSRAFEECRYIQKIELPSSVTKLNSNSFGGCLKLSDIVLPENLSEIQSQTFRYCSSLRTMDIPQSVFSLGNDVFEGCSSMVSFTGKYASEDGRLLINDSKVLAFAAYGLEEYSIPEGITSTTGALGYYTSLPGLKKLVLPSTLTACTIQAADLVELVCYSVNPPSPSWMWFLGMKMPKIETIRVPAVSVDAYKSAEYWSDYADRIFPMEALQPRNEIWYTSTDGKIVEPDLSVGKPALTLLSNTYENGKGVLVFEEDLETIPFGIFSFCKTLESVVFPEGVIVVNNAVFEYCENLVSVRFPSTVTQLGGWLFHDCFNLESVNIPEGVTKIEEATFAQCYKLPTVSLPDGLTEIGHSAFCNCWAFESIRIPETVTSLGEGAFAECRGLKSVTIPSGVTELPPSLFANCNSLTEVIIPEGVTVIGDQVFWYCGALKSARIPSTVISLGDSAFICTSVESVTVPGGVSEIGQECFAGCGSLSSLVLEEGIQVIGQHAFEGCTSLGEVVIPSTVRGIGSYAFYCCDGIYAVYVMPAIPPTLGEEAFVSENEYPLFIPMDFLPDYQEAEGWKDYGHRLKWL